MSRELRPGDYVDVIIRDARVIDVDEDEIALAVDGCEVPCAIPTRDDAGENPTSVAVVPIPPRMQPGEVWQSGAGVRFLVFGDASADRRRPYLIDQHLVRLPYDDVVMLYGELERVLPVAAPEPAAPPALEPDASVALVPAPPDGGGDR